MDYTTIIFILNFLVIILLVFLIFRKNENKTLEEKVLSLYSAIENSTRINNQEKSLLRQEQQEQNRYLREEIANNFERLHSLLLKQLTMQNDQQNEKLEQLSKHMAKIAESNSQQQEKINESVSKSLKELQTSNEQKLEAMRNVVDEKLHTTLNRRLDDSFKTIGEQLQQLYKSLGEMQSLSSGIHSLNKVLTNVKTRGTWGEVQLGALLEQILTPDQYEQSVSVKRGSKERVDFAVKLPGRDQTLSNIWLPIDAKFTQEDYLRLSEASEQADSTGTIEALRSLENRVKQDARSIRDKYINPPNTTDFAVMFLPTEGLYAEVLRIEGLAEYCQTECKIMLAGPTTLAALLNSLRMGFATLAIEKKSSEVWKLLGAIKKQYGMFNQLIDKSLDKLEDAQKSISDAQNRSQQIYKRLNKVEEVEDFALSEKLLSLNEHEEE